jgi:flagella basal body P-ring formation protein FlgA
MWRKLFGLLILLCLIVPTLAWAVPVTVTVRSEATVERDRITIGDVAEVHGQDAQTVAKIRAIIVGQAPPAGETRMLYGGYVITRLKQHGFQPHRLELTVPKQIRIIRAARTLTTSDIEAAVRQALQRQAPWKPEDMTIRDIRGLDSVIVPLGQVRYEVTFPGRGDFLGRTSFSVQLHVDGQRVKRLHGTVSIEIRQKVVVLTRPLAKHAVITPADIHIQRVQFSRTPRQVVMQLAEAVGKRARRALRAKTMLHTYDVEAPPLVQKGDVVTIIVESASLKIATVGEALENGVRGETIRVRNTESRREVRGVVLDKKTVRIPL